MQDFKVSVPKSPWDKPKQKASWEQGFHAGKVGLGLRVSCDFYWQSGWKAGRQYALALEEKAQHDALTLLFQRENLVPRRLFALA
ncbi:MAG: hypothetical protein AAGB19_16965, partial [Cyanobacteria bacterium P01_F01_bin.3]